MIVAIDGPAGAGKSTTARLLAQALGWAYVDTGAMYRALALVSQERGIKSDNGQTLAALALDANIVLRDGRIFVGERDVSGAIRTPEIAQRASQVATLPPVREAMAALQQRIGRDEEARTGGAVLEGRDIQTVVFPDAEIKIFLSAPLQTRAQRRAEELPTPADIAQMQDELSRRDARDTGREVAPLAAAPDAVLLSTDGLSPDEVVECIVELVRARLHQNDRGCSQSL